MEFVIFVVIQSAMLSLENSKWQKSGILYYLFEFIYKFIYKKKSKNNFNLHLSCDDAAAVLLFERSKSFCNSIISSSFAPYEKFIRVLGGGVESSYFLLSLVVLVLLYLLCDLWEEPSKDVPL